MTKPPRTTTPRTATAAPFAYEYPGGSTSERVWTTLVGTDDYNSGYVGVAASAPPGSAVTVSTVAANLRTAGWHVDLTDFGLRARQDATVVELDPDPIAGTPSDGPAGLLNPYLEIGRAAPAEALPAAIVGWLIGATLGVLLTWFGNRRLARRSPAIRAAVTAMTVAGLALLVPGTVLTTGNLLAYASYREVAVWDGYLFWIVRGCTNLGALWLLAALILLPTRQISLPRPNSPVSSAWSR